MSRAAHQTHSSDFYTKTQQALQEREHAAAAKQRDAESVQARLQAAEEQAKKAADSKDKSGKVAIEGNAKKGVAGRVEIDSPDDKKVPGVAAQGGRTRDQTAMQKDETLEEHEVEMELDFILKQSPGMINGYLAHALTLTQSQLSYSPSPTARTRRRRNTSSSTNTASSPSPTWSN